MMQEERYLAARDALYANLNLQERLEDTMKQLEEGINSNEVHKAKLHASALTANRIGWYSGLKGEPSTSSAGPTVCHCSIFSLILLEHESQAACLVQYEKEHAAKLDAQVVCSCEIWV